MLYIESENESRKTVCYTFMLANNKRAIDTTKPSLLQNIVCFCANTHVRDTKINEICFIRLLLIKNVRRSSTK